MSRRHAQWVQMQRLYDVGDRMGALGGAWRSQPPGRRSEP